MPEYQLAQKVAGVQANGIGGACGGKKGGRNSGTIYNAKGKIHTGYYRNWKELSEDDSKNVVEARKQKGGKNSQKASKGEMIDTKRKFSELSSLVEGGIKKIEASIAAISGKAQDPPLEETGSRASPPPAGDAGNAFGGCATKGQKR